MCRSIATSSSSRKRARKGPRASASISWRANTTRTSARNTASPKAARRRAVLGPGGASAETADNYFLQREPRHASMLRTSVTPTILNGGYRFNVIPSEAKATIDVRMVPDENPGAFIDAARKVIADPAVD